MSSPYCKERRHRMAARGYGPDALYVLAQNGWDRNLLNLFYGRMGGKFLATGFNPLLLSKQGEISNHWLEIATFISFNPLLYRSSFFLFLMGLHLFHIFPDQLCDRHPLHRPSLGIQERRIGRVGESWRRYGQDETGSS